VKKGLFFESSFQRLVVRFLNTEIWFFEDGFGVSILAFQSKKGMREYVVLWGPYLVFLLTQAFFVIFNPWGFPLTIAFWADALLALIPTFITNVLIDRWYKKTSTD
jgi:hypothetical protein